MRFKTIANFFGLLSCFFHKMFLLPPLQDECWWDRALIKLLTHQHSSKSNGQERLIYTPLSFLQIEQTSEKFKMDKKHNFISVETAICHSPREAIDQKYLQGKYGRCTKSREISGYTSLTKIAVASVVEQSIQITGNRHPPYCHDQSMLALSSTKRNSSERLPDFLSWFAFMSAGAVACIGVL